MIEREKKNLVVKISIFIISIFIIFISISYAFINQVLTGTKRQAITAGNLQLELKEENSITLENALPVYDEVGMIQKPFDFKLTNHERIPINYVVKLADTTAEDVQKLDTSIVKYGFTKNGVNTIQFLSNLVDGKIDHGMILSGETIEYSLRLWIDFNVEDEELINGKSLSYKIEVEAGQMEGTSRNLVFDSAGGELSDTSKQVVVGYEYGNLPIPTKIGYNFLGWFTEDEEAITENTVLDAFTKKLVAKWGVNQYTVIFDPNGGSVLPNNKQINFNDVYGELPTPTKPEATFLGWFTDISNGEKVENTSVMNVANNHTLYAHWREAYQDKSGASRPVLSDNLVPVTIANNGEVKKADIYEEWYDYDKKVWANAVVLEDKTKVYNVGDIIPNTNIQSYFVWIPRYRYKIFNTGNYSGTTTLENNAKTIEIEFEDKNTALSKGTTVGSWLSHPAFQAFDVNGLWVGKFESGYKNAVSSSAAQQYNTDTANLIVKPSSFSWRANFLGYMFKVCYDYLRGNESHMMKNTEWGATAYLSHSKYGINTEVNMNNNGSFLTGCGADSASASASSTCSNAYGSKTSGIYNQSTTGNISGIFDMNGGANEQVMGRKTTAMSDSSRITTLYPDFFTNNEWEKYYDSYAGDIYSNRMLGDATGELGPFGGNDPRSSWYNASAVFVSSSSPWFERGGANDSNNAYYRTSIFYFSRNSGNLSNYHSFRLVLAL